MDRDSEFVQSLGASLDGAALSYRPLSSPVSVHALVRMRLNALVVDLGMLGSLAWEYLERTCCGLPALAVVVCTGPSSMAQRTRGLRLGADAWMTKPCHPEEVVCVLEAVLRRRRHHQLPDLTEAKTVGEIAICPDLYQAYANGESGELTRREFELLLLLSQRSRVLRREEIYQRLWGYAMARGDRSVDVLVRKLRQKLEAISPEWSYIQTHFGVGYRFEPRPRDAGAQAVSGRAASWLAEPQRDQVSVC